MKDSQDWLDKILISFANTAFVCMDDSGVNDDELDRAKSAIRKHILQEALGLIGNNEEEFHLPEADLPVMVRNRLREELRNKFNNIYKED